MLAPWKESYDKLRQCIKKQRHHFADKGLYCQSYGFSSSHVQTRGLDHREGWLLKNWCFQAVVLEKTLESSPDCKKIKPGNPKANQHWIFIGRTDAEAEAPVIWPSDAKSWLTRKNPDAEKDWRQKEKGVAEDEMVRITNSVGMNLSKLLELTKERGAWCATVHGVTNSWTWLSDWTTQPSILKKPVQG